jgi:hypothetical protein
MQKGACVGFCPDNTLWKITKCSVIYGAHIYVTYRTFAIPSRYPNFIIIKRNPRVTPEPQNKYFSHSRTNPGGHLPQAVRVRV